MSEVFHPTPDAAHREHKLRIKVVKKGAEIKAEPANSTASSDIVRDHTKGWKESWQLEVDRKQSERATRLGKAHKDIKSLFKEIDSESEH